MKPCSVASSTVGWRSFSRDGQRTHKKRSKKLLNAQKNLVEKGYLEVSDDIYTLKVHDAGQTGHDPDSKDYVRAELPDGQDTLLRSVLVSGG
jgi:hypothetical protein